MDFQIAPRMDLCYFISDFNLGNGFRLFFCPFLLLLLEFLDARGVAASDVINNYYLVSRPVRIEFSLFSLAHDTKGNPNFILKQKSKCNSWMDIVYAWIYILQIYIYLLKYCKKKFLKFLCVRKKPGFNFYELKTFVHTAHNMGLILPHSN